MFVSDIAGGRPSSPTQSLNQLVVLASTDIVLTNEALNVQLDSGRVSHASASKSPRVEQELLLSSGCGRMHVYARAVVSGRTFMPHINKNAASIIDEQGAASQDRSVHPVTDPSGAAHMR